MEMNDRISDLYYLAPAVRPKFQELADLLQQKFKEGRLKTLFLPFETFRTPSRQLILYNTQKSRATAMHSAHNYGLAVDFVAYVVDGKTGWSWTSNEYGAMQMYARVMGFETLGWEQCHVQSPLFRRLTTAPAANDNS